MKATVSQKGQVTIPKPLRDKLGISPGMVLDFFTDNGQLIARKKLERDPFSAWIGKGKLPVGRNVDEYLRIIRDGDGD